MSQGLHLDFLRPRRTGGAWPLVLAVLGVAALAAVLFIYTEEVQPQTQATDLSLSRVQQALQAKAAPAGPRMDDKQLAQEWAQAAKVAEQLNAPWAELLDTLEAGSDLDVALLSLEPDQAKREFVLTGEARHYEALMAYLHYLQSQPTLSEVAVHMHQVSRQDRDRPIRFRISAHWGGTP